MNRKGPGWARRARCQAGGADPHLLVSYRLAGALRTTLAEMFAELKREPDHQTARDREESL